MADDTDDAAVPMPLLPPTSIEARLRHFDETVFNVSETSHIYHLVNALCGDSGASDLKKNLLLQRLNKSLSTTHFWDLDRLFGGTINLARLNIESYPYDPENDMLTAEQWDEVRVKDAWYRARALDFWKACQLGGTPDGFRMMVHSAVGVTCDLFETWQLVDNYGVKEQIGRTTVNQRPEVFIRPHKDSITPKEKQLILHAIDRIKPVDSVVTVDVEGVPLHKPVTVRTIAADSSYFEVQKTVTGTPNLDKIPPPEVLQDDIRASEAWLEARVMKAAPNTAFNNTMETSICYVYDPAGKSPVDSVKYFEDAGKGLVPHLTPYQETTNLSDAWTPYIPYERADSPDNYPGGKNGVTPMEAPALNPNGQAYVFPYQSQQDYISQVQNFVHRQGGETTVTGYRLPLRSNSTSVKTYPFDMALPLVAPGSESTISSPWIAPSNESIR